MTAKDLIRGLGRRQDSLEWLQEATVFWKGPQNTVKNVILGNVARGVISPFLTVRFAEMVCFAAMVCLPQ